MGINLLLLVLVVAAPEQAVDDVEKQPFSFENLIKTAHDKSHQDVHDTASPVVSTPSFSEAALIKSLPEDVQKAYHADLVAHYQHNQWALAQRERIYEWQYWSGVVVFVVSVGVVLAGLYMAWLQFDSAYRAARTTEAHLKSAAPSDNTALASQVELLGVKVTTPIVGIVILTLSLGFFYLYLRFVYPIQ